MRSAELRLKEETAVARLEERKKTRAEEQKKSVKNTYKLYKSLKPDATETAIFQWIRANTDVSLSDKEIEDILKENK